MKDLRHFLALLDSDAPGELLRVQRSVNARFEVSAILARLEACRRHPALYCPTVQGFDFPVVTNLMASRRRLAIALGTTEPNLIATYRQLEQEPIPPILVDSGPVKAVLAIGDRVDLERLPILTHHTKDAAPYITAGAMVVKDPETGIRNLGIYRYQLKGPRRLGLNVTATSDAGLI